MFNLSENEHIITISRKHWWILIGKITSVLFLGLIPVLIYSVWGIISPQITIPNEEVFKAFSYLGSALYYTFLWLYFCITFVDYFLDVWIVTDMRILDVEQRGLFNREISECYLSKIQDVTVETKGIMSTFLNFGDLHIQTAAEKREFVFQQIADPNKVKNIILDQYNKQQASINR